MGRSPTSSWTHILRFSISCNIVFFHFHWMVLDPGDLVSTNGHANSSIIICQILYHICFYFVCSLHTVFLSLRYTSISRVVIGTCTPLTCKLFMIMHWYFARTRTMTCEVNYEEKNATTGFSVHIKYNCVCYTVYMFGVLNQKKV